MLDAVAERNLVLTGLTPQAADDLSLPLFADVPSLDARGRLPFDSTIWLEQRPDRPENGFPTCPDCGGSGDLGEQGPAQVLVDRQARHDDGSVEDALQPGEVVGMPREGGIRDDELLLLVAAGDRGVQHRADDVDALVDHRGTGGFGKEPAQGG